MHATSYTSAVPKLWNQTIEAHRSAVQDAILDSTLVLAAEHGVLSVTMSQIAKQAGIGRATLYKYFPDVRAIVGALHDRQVAEQLERLHQARNSTDPGEQLEEVLRIHAMMVYEHHGSIVAPAMHQAGHAAGHQQAFLTELLAEAAGAGVVRSDVPPDELARYCLHALSAAAEANSIQAVERLAGLVIGALQARV